MRNISRLETFKRPATSGRNSSNDDIESPKKAKWSQYARKSFDTAVLVITLAIN